MLAFQEFLTYPFFISLLVSNIAITLALMLTVVARVRFLGVLVPMLSAFVKLFPYTLSIAALNLTSMALFSPTLSTIICLTALANLPFFLSYLLLH